MKHLLIVIFCLIMLGVNNNIYLVAREEFYKFKIINKVKSGSKIQKNKYKDEYIDLAINYDLGIYEMNFSQKVTHDIIFESTISLGEVKKKKDTIILIDKIFKYKMTLVKSYIDYPLATIYLDFINPPLFFRDVRLHFVSNNATIDKNSYNYTLQNYSFNERKIKNIKKTEIKMGIYRSIDGDGKYDELVLRDDGIYILNYYILPFSKGKWKQKGNKIILYENDFKTEFKLQVVSDKKLIALHLPLFTGNYIDSRTLNLVEE